MRDGKTGKENEKLVDRVTRESFVITTDLNTVADLLESESLKVLEPVRTDSDSIKGGQWINPCLRPLGYATHGRAQRNIPTNP